MLRKIRNRKYIRRTYRKRRITKPKYSKIKRIVRRLVPKPEMKYFSVTNFVECGNTAWTTYPWFPGISQGVQLNNRLGNKIRILWTQVRFYITRRIVTANVESAIANVRILLIKPAENQSTIIVPGTDLPSRLLNFVDINTNGPVLYDRRFVVAPLYLTEGATTSYNNGRVFGKFTTNRNKILTFAQNTDTASIETLPNMQIFSTQPITVFLTSRTCFVDY